MRLLIKALSLFVPGASNRKRVRKTLLIKYYTFLAKRTVGRLGRNVSIEDRISASRRVFIGDGTDLKRMKVYGGAKVYIGNHVSIGPNLQIQTQNHDYEGEALPYGKRFVCKDVHIDDCVWIGMNVLVLPGTHIGEGAIIQTGSVVHGEIPPLAIAGGNPAKVFMYRDKAHYWQLKKEKRYLRA